MDGFCDGRGLTDGTRFSEHDSSGTLDLCASPSGSCHRPRPSPAIWLHSLRHLCPRPLSLPVCFVAMLSVHNWNLKVSDIDILCPPVVPQLRAECRCAWQLAMEGTRNATEARQTSKGKAPTLERLKFSPTLNAIAAWPLSAVAVSYRRSLLHSR